MDVLNGRRTLVTLLAALVVAASACSVPASVDGVLLNDEFTIRDDNPQVRPQNDGASLIVMADDANGVLRLVKLRVADLEALPLDEPREDGELADPLPYLQQRSGPERQLAVMVTLPELRETDDGGRFERMLRERFELALHLPCWVGPKDESVYVYLPR